MPPLLQLQKLLGKGDGGWRKSVFALFFGWQDRKFVEKMRFGASYSTNVLPDTFWLRASKTVFKVGSVKFTNSLSPPSTVKKVCTWSKSSQGRDLSDARQKSRELTTSPELPNSKKNKNGKMFFYDHVNSSWHIDGAWLLSLQAAPLVNPHVTNNILFSQHPNRMKDLRMLNKNFIISNGAWTLMMRNISCNKMWQFTMHYFECWNQTQITVHSTRQHSTTWWSDWKTVRP